MTPVRRIGFLTPGWPGQNTPNGIATSVYNLAMGLHDIGKTPVILARSIDGYCPPDIPVVPLPELSWLWKERVRAKLGDTSAVQRHVARRIAAAVHTAIASHGLEALVMEETNGWAAMVQAQVPVPVIVTLHGPWTVLKSMASLGASEDARRELREQTGFRAAAGIIAPSRNVLAAIEKMTPLPSTPKIVLPNTFLSKASVPLSATRLNHDILFVGRFDFLKGADTVLDAFSRVTEKHPEARLTFVGPDRGIKQPNGSRLHMDATLANLPCRIRERIYYTGPLGKEEVAQLRATHPIALIASRYENFPYSLLEAMAAGQAIICTAVGGPGEVLKDEQTALLVPPGDPEVMATALCQLIEDLALRCSLGEAAQAKLQSDFSPQTVAIQTVSFVEQILRS